MYILVVDARFSDRGNKIHSTFSKLQAHRWLYGLM